MSCSLLVDAERGGPELACFYDTVTMTAFGPVIDGADKAEAFSEWLGDDPRRFTEEELIQKYGEFTESLS